MRVPRMLFIIITFFSCTPVSLVSRKTISDQIKKQYGFDLNNDPKPGINSLPASVDTSDGITEAEAVSLALYNNAQYQSDLASITIAQADVTDAGVVSNPLIRYLLPSGGLSVSGYINFGFDFLWQRPKRIALAQSELQRTGANMLQRGYTVIRDVETGFAELQLAKERAAIYAENAGIRAEMARLNNTRLRLGDISELEASTTRADSAAAIDDFYRACLDTMLRNNRLNLLLGYTSDTVIRYKPTFIIFENNKIEEQLYIKLAHENNAELKSAELAIHAAARKIGWERSRIIAFMATLGFGHNPAHGGNKNVPNAFQPGIQMELPILNRNQGKISRARAELQQASLNYTAVLQRINADLADAYDRYTQVYKSYIIYNSGVMASLEENVRLVQITFKRGDISYLPVLEAMRQLVNGKLRKAEIEADLRKSVSQLNFVIGKKTAIQ